MSSRLATGRGLLQLLGLAGVALSAISVFTPFLNVLTAALGGAYRLERADAIVVLGGGGVEADGILGHTSLRRTLWGIELHRRGLAPLLVVSGASGPTGPTEAAVRTELARRLSVPPEAILTESRARTTREEALLLRDRLQPRGIRRILLVSDPIAMPRARGVFARAGFEVLPAPPDSGQLQEPGARLGLMRSLAGELLGWLYYRAAGYL